MVRILVVLVGAGVLINALTFLMVAHYFSGKGGDPAGATSPPRSSAPEPSPPSPELLKRMAALETGLGAISKKLDGIASRAAQAAPLASPKRQLRPAIIPTRPQPPATGAAQVEEGEEGGAEEVLPAPTPAPPAGQTPPLPIPGSTPAPAAEGQPETAPEGQTPPAAPEGREAPEEGAEGGAKQGGGS